MYQVHVYIQHRTTLPGEQVYYGAAQTESSIVESRPVI